MILRARILKLPKYVVTNHRTRSSIIRKPTKRERKSREASYQRSQLPVKFATRFDGGLKSDNQGLDATTRKNILQQGIFATWLADHLDRLADCFKEDGFAQYLKELKINLRSHKVHRQALGDHVIGTGSALLRRPTGSQNPQELYKALGAVFLVDGEAAVNSQLKYSYSIAGADQQLSAISLEDQKQIADLRHPAEWYPATRAIQRTIHLHVGPTNSGKTYNALKRLEQAESGAYAGPLRLLAHEVYGRLNAQGKPCDLVTGDERIIVAKDGRPSSMQSCTVEMLPLNTDFEVAVIDEIQMIGHEQRGWAWTQALLGLKARELHVCGEERTVPLIRELAASMGDTIEVHTYQRLSPLKTMSSSLRGNLTKLRKGDCVVVFSRLGLHAMRSQIEKATKRRVAIIYGSLPPEVRAQQARLFNEPDNDYDFLVATDAIGMGLNLAIKRIIFESVHKFNGFRTEPVESAQIKQIAGRAGRFRVAAGAESQPEVGEARNLPVANVGLITTLEPHDLLYVQKSMQQEVEPLMSAGIIPPTDVVEKYAAYFSPSTNLGHIMQRLEEIARVHPRFRLCQTKDQSRIAGIIHTVENLSIRDRLIFCASPAPLGVPGGHKRPLGMEETIRAFARCVADNSSGALLEIPELDIDILNERMTLDRTYLDRLERLHQALVLYLWLSYRFDGVFVDQDMAFYLRSLVENRIEKMLTEFSALDEIQKKMKRMRKMSSHWLREEPANPDMSVANQDAAKIQSSQPLVDQDVALESSQNPPDVETLASCWPDHDVSKPPQAVEILEQRGFTNLYL